MTQSPLTTFGSSSSSLLLLPRGNKGHSHWAKMPFVAFLSTSFPSFLGPPLFSGSPSACMQCMHQILRPIFLNYFNQPPIIFFDLVQYLLARIIFETAQFSSGKFSSIFFFRLPLFSKSVGAFPHTHTPFARFFTDEKHTPNPLVFVERCFTHTPPLPRSIVKRGLSSSFLISSFTN